MIFPQSKEIQLHIFEQVGTCNLCKASINYTQSNEQNESKRRALTENRERIKKPRNQQGSKGLNEDHSFLGEKKNNCEGSSRPYTVWD